MPAKTRQSMRTGRQPGSQGEEETVQCSGGMTKRKVEITQRWRAPCSFFNFFLLENEINSVASSASLDLHIVRALGETGAFFFCRRRFCERRETPMPQRFPFVPMHEKQRITEYERNNVYVLPRPSSFILHFCGGGEGGATQVSSSRHLPVFFLFPGMGGGDVRAGTLWKPKNRGRELRANKRRWGYGEKLEEGGGGVRDRRCGKGGRRACAFASCTRGQVWVGME